MLELSLFLMSCEDAAELRLQYAVAAVPAVKELLAVFGEVGDEAASIDGIQSATPALKRVRRSRR